jgi:hypothetical protein
LPFILFCYSHSGSESRSNPSFEDTVICTIAPFPPISNAVGWRTCHGSSDYWNVCSGSVPNNPTLTGGIAYQSPASGNAYAGFICQTAPGLREIIATTLISPMLVDQKYYFSYKIVLASCFETSVSHVGIKFSKEYYSGFSNHTLINNFAHFYYPYLITDTANWTTVSGSFVADSAYQHLMIGNFFTVGNYLTAPSSCGTQQQNYFFIDDICVSIDSNYCNTWTAIADLNITYEVSIYPNPANNNLTISYQLPQTSAKAEIALYDLSGKKIISYICNTLARNLELDISELSAGSYIAAIVVDGKIRVREKVVVR